MSRSLDKQLASLHVMSSKTAIDSFVIMLSQLVCDMEQENKFVYLILQKG